MPTVYVTDAEIAESPTTRAAGVLRTVDIRRGSLGVREYAVDQWSKLPLDSRQSVTYWHHGLGTVHPGPPLDLHL